MHVRGGVAVLAALVAVIPLHAQAVRGVLVERGTNRPVRGAFVALLDAQENEVTRALTDDAGRFLMRAPLAGTYRVQSKRIGFRLFVSEPIALAAAQTVAYRAEVETVPAMLPPVVVEGRPQCGSRGEAGSVMARLWEEAREALLAVKWTSGEGQHRYELLMFERDFGAVGDQITKERTWTKSGYSDSPFRSAPADVLADRGYVVEEGRDRVYFAPDANVLLSDVFLDTHCFTARAGIGEDAGLVGLAFEPAPGRHLPDVEGVLWFDRTSAELRRLVFAYAKLPGDLPRGPLGGRLEFMRLANGGWIVLRWWIRMPMMGRVVYRDTGREAHSWVMGYRQTGGQVTYIASARGVVVYSTSTAILEGTVVDSTRRGVRLPRATVFLQGTADSTRTDGQGGFLMDTPLEGSYRVAFRHPRLDSLGLAPRATEAALELGRRTTLTLAIPPEERVVGQLCAAEEMAPGSRVMVGMVRQRGTGEPAGNVTVEARWQVVDGVRSAVTVRNDLVGAAVDSAGRYVLCGVPLGTVTLRVTGPGRSSDNVKLRFVEEGVWVNDDRYRSWPSRIWTQDLVVRP